MAGAAPANFTDAMLDRRAANRVLPVSYLF
jgi:hypothetical protein